MSSGAIDQVVSYALDLKNFHQGSHHRLIVPLLVATAAPNRETVFEMWADDVMKPVYANQANLLPIIGTLTSRFSREAFDPIAWSRSAYKPTPTIVEAAQALYQGHDVSEISRSEAGAENLSETGAFIGRVIDDAKRNHRKAICFVTGVPGSGKTLAGLNIANSRMNAHEEEHSVFLSGNGPLVDVLRQALANDEVERRRANGEKQFRMSDAYRKASTFIQNIHHFRDEYLKSSEAPTERVVVFDEAQRAWTKEQTSRFMREKRGHAEFGMSEPEYLLSVMDRHTDWCVVVCLVGGGQEINTGEAGLSEWLSALNHRFSDWRVCISDQLTETDYFATGGRLEALELPTVEKSPALHLAVSVRSFRAEALSEFVGKVVEGNAAQARQLLRKLDNYPLVLTRHLDTAREWLRSRVRGTERTGLVASSNALRLKPAGLYVKARIDPPVWFLGDKSDVRSSYALEDVATEFDIQGLELDWVGVCWDANFRRTGDRWKCFNFRGARWENVSDPERAAYLTNAYRVLLTRARQGMVIFVPMGSDIDETRRPIFYDETISFLRECGLKEI